MITEKEICDKAIEISKRNIAWQDDRVQLFNWAQSLCAAGPWRTDVENAPRDGSDVWGKFEEVGTELHVSVGWSNDHYAWIDGFGRSYSDTLLTAFAVPNPPQVTT